jgi:hypothetical protein
MWNAARRVQTFERFLLIRRIDVHRHYASNPATWVALALVAGLTAWFAMMAYLVSETGGYSSLVEPAYQSAPKG